MDDTLPAAGPGPLPNAADNLDRLDAISNQHLNDMGVDTSEPPAAPLPALGNAVAQQTPARPVRVAQVSMPGVMLDAQPSQSERLDDIYRLAQSDRQSQESLDWLMKQTGGYPPPPAPGQEPAGQQAPAAPPQAPEAQPEGEDLGILGRFGAGITRPRTPAEQAELQAVIAANSKLISDIVRGLDPREWGGGPLRELQANAGFVDAIADWIKETTGADPRQFPGLGFRNVGQPLGNPEDVRTLRSRVPAPSDVGLRDTPETTTGHILQAMTQFATAYVGLGKLVPGMKAPAPGIDRLTRQFFRATAAEYIGFEGNEKNLADLLLAGGDNLPDWARVASPAFRNAATEWLANKEGENEFIARLKNSVAAGPLNALLPWVMNMGAVARNQRFLTHLTGSENFAEAKELLKQAGMPDETISTIVNYGLGSALRESRIDPNEFMMAMAQFHAMRPPRRGGPLHPEAPPSPGDPSAPRPGLPEPGDAAAPPASGQPVPGAGSPPSQELTTLIERLNQGAQSLDARVGGRGDLTTGDVLEQMQGRPGQAPQAGRAAAQAPQPGEFLGSDNAPLIQQIERQLPPRAEYGIPDQTLARWMFDNLDRGEWRMPESAEARPATTPSPTARPANLDMVRLTNEEVDLAMNAIMARSQWFAERDGGGWSKSKLWQSVDQDAMERAWIDVSASGNELRRRLGTKTFDALVDDIMMKVRERASFDDVAKYVRERFGFEGEVQGAAGGRSERSGSLMAQLSKLGRIDHDPTLPSLSALERQAAKRFGVAADESEFPIIAATKYGNNIYTENIHGARVDSAVGINRSGGEEIGFLTNRGRFVGRDEAAKLVRAIDEGFKPRAYGLDSHDIGRTGRGSGETQAAASSPRLPQPIARAINGADETLSKHWEQLPQGLREAIVRDAEVMPPYAVGERITTRVMDRAVESGHKVQIEKRVIEAVHDAVRPLVPLVPPGYRFGVLERVAPIKDTRDVAATFRLANGRTITRAMSWDQLNGSRAFHATGGGLGDFIGLVRRHAPVAGNDFSSQFAHSLRGEMAHEVGHALLRTVSNPVRERLFAHADDLQILDMSLNDYFKAISREDQLDAASGNLPLRRLYQDFYKKSSRQDELIREESITIMLEMIQHGHIKVAAKAGLQQDLDALFGQHFPTRAPKQGDVQAAVAGGLVDRLSSATAKGPLTLAKPGEVVGPGGATRAETKHDRVAQARRMGEKEALLPLHKIPRKGLPDLEIVRDGRVVGGVDYAVKGDTARIHFIVVSPEIGRLSRHDIRDLREAFRKLHPEVTRFEGDRISGAKAKLPPRSKDDDGDPSSFQSVIMAAIGRSGDRTDLAANARVNEPNLPSSLSRIPTYEEVIQGAADSRSLMDRIRSLGKDSWGELSTEEKIGLGKPDTTGAGAEHSLSPHRAGQKSLDDLAARTGIDHDPSLPPLSVLAGRAAARFGVTNNDIELPIIAASKYGDQIFVERIHSLREDEIYERVGPKVFELQEFGFLTNHARFVSRNEATQLAQKADKRFDSKRLDTDHLTGGPKGRPAYFARGGGDSAVKSGTREMSELPEGEIQAAAGGNMPPVPPSVVDGLNEDIRFAAGSVHSSEMQRAKSLRLISSDESEEILQRTGESRFGELLYGASKKSDAHDAFAYDAERLWIMRDDTPVGFITYEIFPASPSAAYIAYFKFDDPTGAMTRADIRAIREQFRAIHPEVKTFEGLRTTGSTAGTDNAKKSVIMAAAGGRLPPVPPSSGARPSPPATPPNNNFSREFQVNWTHIESQDQLKAVAGQMMDAFRDEMVARGVSGGGKGHVQTWEQTAQQAGMLDAIEHLFKIGDQKGITHNAVGMEALGTLYTSSMKELERLVRLAASPQATPETYVQMRHQMTMHRMVQNEFWGGVSEAGRTLNILRKVKSSSQGYQQSLQQIIESTGGVDSNRALAEALAGYLDEGNFRRLDEVLEKGITARTIDAVIEMRTGGLLTGPPTWERNIIGNTLAMPLSILERKVAEYIGAVLHPIDGVKFGEAAAMAQGQMRSLREGLSALAESWTTGEFRLGQSSVEQYATRPSALGAEAMNLSTPDAWRNRQEPAWAERGDPNAQPGNIGPHDARRFKALVPGSGLYSQLAAKPSDTFGLAVDILSQVYGHMSFRPTGAPDAFFKVIHKNAELYAQAWRKANDEILRGEISDADFETRLTELRQNPTEDMTEAANRAANYNTWTDENTSTVGRAVQMLRASEHPAVRLAANVLVPFWRTPSRILNYTFERTPLAPLSAKVQKAIGDGGPEADLAYARMALGTMMLGLGGSLLVEGWISSDKGAITGGMPTKRPLREAAQRLGAKDYSVRIPTGDADKDGDPVYAFIPIQNIGGAADIFLWGAMLADARNRMDHLRNRDPENVDRFEIDWDKAMAAAVFASADLMMSKSSLQGVSEFMRAIGTRETTRQVNWSERLLQSFVPASSGLRYARRQGVPGVVEGDPVKREVTGYIDALYDIIPGLSTQLPPSLDTWGRPITYESGLGGAFDAFMPFATRTSENAQAIDKELLRLGWGPETPRSISILRSEAAQQALERGGSRSGGRRRDRGLGILDSVLADPSEFRTGESNVVTLSGMPKVMNRLIELRGQTSAAQLVRDNEEHLVSANRAAVVRSLDEYGDKTLLQVLNDLVKDPRYLSREMTDDQRQQAIQDIIRDFEMAAKSQVAREFPELQKRRDAMPRPRRGEAAPPARGQPLAVQ